MSGKSWRDNKFVPITEKPTDRPDGEILPDLPNLDRIGNLIRYMLKHPAYTDPNPWPQSIMCHGFDAKGYLCQSGVISTEQFENFSDDQFMSQFDPRILRVIVIPAVAPASEGEKILAAFFGQPHEDIQKIFQYMAANRWYIDRAAPTFEQFVEGLAEMDEEFRKPVLVTDPGLRDANGKLPVDVVFSQPGTAMPWFSGSDQFPTPEDLRQDFDKPDELEVIKDPHLGYHIVRKSHLSHIKRRGEVVTQVLAKYGIAIEDVEKLPMQRILELRQEIQDAMEKSE